MKEITKDILTIILVGIATMCLTSCFPDDELTDRQQFLEKVNATWGIDNGASVEVDNQDITHLVEGFELDIDDKLNFTTNSDEISIQPFPWPASGNFILNSDMTGLTRNDGMPIEIELENDDVFSLSFTYTDVYENSVSRTSGIRNSWKMRCKRK